MKKPRKKINKGLIVMSRGERIAMISLLSVITLLLGFSVFRPAIQVSKKEKAAFHNLDSMIALNEKKVEQQNNPQEIQVKAPHTEPSIATNTGVTNTSQNSEVPPLAKPSQPISTSKPAEPKKTVTPASKTYPILDINLADSTALVALPQIAEVMASRIHRYRDRLGGFVSFDQLFEVKGMDSARFATIKPYIILGNKEITKINVNRDDFKTLLRHPYLEYEQVKAIVNYRERKGLIKDWEQLKTIVGEVNPMLEKYVGVE